MLILYRHKYCHINYSMRKIKAPIAIRLTVTNEVRQALLIAKKRYPTLSDSEILKLGLSKIVNHEASYSQERTEIRAASANGVGLEYLGDQEEDIYSSTDGTRVHFA